MMKCNFAFFHSYAETRLRAPSRLIANLRYEDAIVEADEDGFNSPMATTAELQRALEVLAAQDVEEEHGDEIVEEEKVIYNWEELEGVNEDE